MVNYESHRFAIGDAAGAPSEWSWGPISLFLSLEADLVSPLVPRPSSLTAPAKVSIYLPELQLMSESTTTATPAPAWDYVWFGGQPLAQIEVATGAVRTYFNDHLGTPILQTDAAGTVVWRIEHEPYGEDYAFRAGADLHQPLRFPGQEREVGSELAYNVFRWYRGGWGRYSQADPIGLEGGWNLYRYAAANPLFYFDPDGLKVCSCKRRLANPFFGATLAGSTTWNPVVAFGMHHQYIQIVPDGSSCGGYGGNAWGFQAEDGGSVQPEQTPGFNPQIKCKEVTCIDEDLLMQNILGSMKNPPAYEICTISPSWNSGNCQGWADSMFEQSKDENCCPARGAK
jgi:RHS repeat-associated protein